MHMGLVMGVIANRNGVFSDSARDEVVFGGGSGGLPSSA